jgi:two-component system CheB/CheR fusion protein
MEAFLQLLKALPPAPGMAFVYISHLAPDHKSLLPEIFSAATRMAVAAVSGPTRILVDHVYVIPPGKNMIIGDGVLKLRRRSRTMHTGGIDHFLESLALDCEARSVGVILSGEASDGARGLEAIKAAGGITFAQDEKSAAHSSMPHAATLYTCVDYILSPRRMAKALLLLRDHHTHLNRDDRDDADGMTRLRPDEEEALRKILSLVRSATTVDFSGYKPTTIRRRILRRMALIRAGGLSDFAQILARNPGEVTKLYQDILIHVTGFFRDKEAYAVFKRRAYPRLLTANPPSAPIRIWVAGCSTGEEAYSHAMNPMEFLSERGERRSIQIFATDLSEEALKKARAGIYPSEIAQELSASRLRRFFVKVSRGYQIRREVRELCIFTRHDLVNDPPFGNLDLVSCRNVLIYLGAGLQRNVLRIFDYALKPGGFLMLGNSENVPETLTAFAVIHRRAKIFSRKLSSPRPRLGLVGFAPAATISRGETLAMKTSSPSGYDSDFQNDINRINLSNHVPPGVVVNDAMEILQCQGHTSPYLELAPGRLSSNLLKMARSPLLPELADAVAKARRSGEPVKTGGISMEYEGWSRDVAIEVNPLPLRPETRNEKSFYIVFQELSRTELAPHNGKAVRPAAQPGEDRLRRDLEKTRKYLDTVIRERDESNTKLGTVNEEIVSTNEELRSMNEELETSKEELQSSNEELSTVNEELSQGNAELEKAKGDLLNLIDSTNLPIIMVRTDMRLGLMTPAARKILGLSAADTGWQLNDIKHKLGFPRIEKSLREVMETGRAVPQEVVSVRGHWYTMWVKPYRTAKKQSVGAVIALVDITERKLKEDALSRLAQVVRDSNDALCLYDLSGKIIAWNRGAEKMFGWSAVDALKRNLHDIVPNPLRRGALDVARLRKQAKPGIPFETTRIAKDGKIIDVSITATEVHNAAGKVVGVASTVRDISPLRIAEQTRFKFLLDGAPSAAIVTDKSGRIMLSNPKSEKLFGYAKGELIGRSIEDILPKSLRSRHIPRRNDAKPSKQRSMDTALALLGRRKNGEQFTVEASLHPLTYDRQPAVLAHIVDITDRQRVQEAEFLRRKEAMQRDFVANASHQLRTPVTVIKGYAEALLAGALADRKNGPEFLHIIDENADHLGEMIEDLLDLGAIDGGQRKPALRNISLRGLVDKKISRYKASASIKNISMRSTIKPGLLVSCDAIQIQHVLGNLIDNAIRYSRIGDPVVISARREKTQVLVSVRNKGGGILAKELATIFDRFKRTKKAIASGVKGTGLGLAIAKSIVEAHGGRIWATSSRSKGTAFNFSLLRG